MAKKESIPKANQQPKPPKNPPKPPSLVWTKESCNPFERDSQGQSGKK